MDMGAFIAPKSDQLNADDLIPGPRNITVTRVSANEGNAEQPVSVYFEGDGNKPFRPCKSMRRVMVAVWGRDASAYAGRSMTLYRDPTVTWGGMEVGGIRISHMSHIDRDMVMALTATKKARKPYTVKPLRMEAPKPAAPDKVAEGVADLIRRVNGAMDMAALEAITADADVVKQRKWLEKNRPADAEAVTQAVSARLLTLEAAGMPDDGWPGPTTTQEPGA